MIAKIKDYALLILGGLVAALVFLLRIFGARAKRLGRQNDKLKATVKRSEEVINADIQANEQADIRAAEIARDLESGVTEYDPNELWNDDKR